LAACATGVLADLPVHCLRHQIVGHWQFVLSNPSSERSGCGHHRPDVEEGQPGFSIVDHNRGKEVTVELQQPNIARINGVKGTWTMIYDEGLEVKVGDQTFMAFSNFTVDKPPLPHNISHCDGTQVGWFSNAKRTEYGCFYGRQVQAAESKHTVTPVPKSSTHSSDQPLDHQSQVVKVQQINKKIAMLQLGWKAAANHRWNGMTMGELNNFAGIKRTVPVHDQHRELLAQHVHVQHKSFFAARWKDPFFAWREAS